MFAVTYLLSKNNVNSLKAHSSAPPSYDISVHPSSPVAAVSRLLPYAAVNRH